MKKIFVFPEKPTWPMFNALFAVMFVLLVVGIVVVSGFQGEIDDMEETIDRGGVVLNTLIDGQEDLEANAVRARERAYASRAQGCLIVILDNDRNFDLTAACTEPVVTAYYPAGVCAQFFPQVAECGSKATEPAN